MIQYRYFCRNSIPGRDPDRPGFVYLGTQSSDVWYGDLTEGLADRRALSAVPHRKVNCLTLLDGTLWACTDNGVGFFDVGGSYTALEDIPLNRSVDRMMRDYEGVVFVRFASGLLHGVLGLVFGHLVVHDLILIQAQRVQQVAAVDQHVRQLLPHVDEVAAGGVPLEALQQLRRLDGNGFRQVLRSVVPLPLPVGSEAPDALDGVLPHGVTCGSARRPAAWRRPGRGRSCCR